MNSLRTRFAPSPTGYLHIGGARTALYCWLMARKNQGKFVLRIEDTDRERSTKESVQAILDSMAWLGLDADEGPFYQSDRTDRYAAAISQLLTENKAYRCYCSKEELAQMREEQTRNKQKPRYDGRCRNRSGQPEGAPFVIRFANPQAGQVVVDDQVHGRVVFNNQELDDLIIARSDGSPTYNLTVVIDDIDMGITHVLRGDDHLNNTPRQINLFRALGADCPVFAHVPMILGPDGSRLSKRHGAVSVMQYRDQGILPEALLNYLVRLGWSHGDQEIFSLDEMVQLFEVGDINKKASAVNPDKLLWLNQHYIKHGDRERLGAILAWHLEQMGAKPSSGPALADVVGCQSERAKSMQEMAVNSRFFYEDFDDYDPKAARKNLTDAARPALIAVRDQLAGLESWDESALHKIIESVAEDRGLKMGKVAQPVRVAVSGGAVSPPIDQTLALLGKTTVLSRLDRAIGFIAELETREPAG